MGWRWCAPQALNLRGALAPLKVTTAAVTPPRRGALVLIDGLRADVAHTLPGLQALAQQGATATLEADSPTFSAPQYVAVLTGVPPRDSGVRNNLGVRPVGLDSVPSMLHAAGQRGGGGLGPRPHGPRRPRRRRARGAQDLAGGRRPGREAGRGGRGADGRRGLDARRAARRARAQRRGPHAARPIGPDPEVRASIAASDQARLAQMPPRLETARAQLRSMRWPFRAGLLVLGSVLAPPRAAVRPGLRLGVAALSVSAGVALLLGLSFSSAHDTPFVALRLSAAGGVGALRVAWRQGRVADRALAESLRDVALLVASLLAVLAAASEGITGPRFVCEPASLAVAPLAAFAGYLAVPLLGWVWAAALLSRAPRPLPH